MSQEQSAHPDHFGLREKGFDLELNLSSHSKPQVLQSPRAVGLGGKCGGHLQSRPCLGRISPVQTVPDNPASRVVVPNLVW